MSLLFIFLIHKHYKVENNNNFTNKINMYTPKRTNIFTSANLYMNKISMFKIKVINKNVLN